MNCYDYSLIADPPTSVEILEAKENSVGFEPNVKLTLTCRVNDAKPQANVTWLSEGGDFKAVFPSIICKLKKVQNIFDEPSTKSFQNHLKLTGLTKVQPKDCSIQSARFNLYLLLYII